ncbi:hypothetical protein Syun_027641 [Stephania yunnanensis]|uniref:Uncharacterized protein n=1 Tax=Stephania yunnanensis TaxID=152371 RepID=A0AAP0HRF9_9MAGN
MTPHTFVYIFRFGSHMKFMHSLYKIHLRIRFLCIQLTMASSQYHFALSLLHITLRVFFVGNFAEDGKVKALRKFQSLFFF